MNARQRRAVRRQRRRSVALTLQRRFPARAFVRADYMPFEPRYGLTFEDPSYGLPATATICVDRGELLKAMKRLSDKLGAKVVVVPHTKRTQR